MEITEITDELGHADTSGTEHCEECGAPLDRLQRYCVSCGTRHLAVPDPAATYLAQASARARLRPRAAGAGAGARRSGRRRLSNTTALLALIAILVAIGVGVLIGHATGGSNDSAQLQRLSQQVTKLEAGASASTSSNGSSSSSTSGGSTSSGKTKSATSGVDNATGKAYLKKALHSSGTVTVP